MAGELPDRSHRHHADDAVIRIDLDGVVVGWDAAAEETFGWSPDHVVGRPLADVVAPPEDADRLLAAIARAGEASPPLWRVEVTAQRGDGHRLPVELTVLASGRDDAGLTVVARDLTAECEAESAKRQLAAVTRACDEAILVETLEGTITTWSRGAERMLGWRADEVVGGPARRLVPADLADEAVALGERVRHGETVSAHVTRRLHRDGGTVDVVIAMAPVIDDLGVVTGAATTARVAGEHATAPTGAGAAGEQAVADRELRAALDEARRSEERARAFLADAAHQLRRPVTGMQSCAEALLTGPPQDKREWLLASLVRETARAGRLIAVLLQMARLDQGERVQPEPCDVVALCTDEMDRLYSLAPHLDLVIRAEPVEDTCPALDANAVREILSNLLDNARRYAVSRVTVEVAVAAATVEIRVSDDGPGLASEVAERAFDRFMTMDDRGGSGLGLPVARSFARAHGGDLTYEDDAFVLRLPSGTDQQGRR